MTGHLDPCDLRAVRSPEISYRLELSEIVLASKPVSKTTAARKALRTMLADGRLAMEPLPDGSYRARSIILSLTLREKLRLHEIG